jgi:hypothetical protein
MPGADVNLKLYWKARAQTCKVSLKTYYWCGMRARESHLSQDDKSQTGQREAYKDRGKRNQTGADLFDALKFADRLDRRFGVFLFGGTDDVAKRVGKLLNAQSRGLKCVGTLNPGLGTVDEMSSEQIIEAINASGADILAVF